MVAILCATRPALPAEGERRAGEDPDTIGALADRIAAEQAANGPYSVALIELLGTLGILYDEDGQHALAAAMIERAMQVVRANYGLRSFEQAPFLEQRIATEEARGNFAGAWDLEQALLELVAVNPNDLRTVPVLRAVAVKRMTIAERYATGEFPPQILLGCFYNPSRNPAFGSCSSGSKSAALAAVVADARRHYRAAIDVLVRQGESTSDEVRDLEQTIVHDSYRHGAYRAGRQALRRLFAYDAESSAPLLELADSALKIGDWDLAFGQHPIALDIYERVYAELVARGVDAALIEQRFAPAVPSLVPMSEPNPFAPAQAGDDAAFIDVAFEVTKYGRGRRPHVLATSPGVTADDREALRDLIIKSRFRPRLVDGRFVDTAVTARRYLAVAAPAARRRATLPRP